MSDANDSLYYAIHRRVVGKPEPHLVDAAMRQTFRGWENRSKSSIKSLKAYVLGKGHAFTFVNLKPDDNYRRQESEVTLVGGIGLDFDDPGLNWDDAQADPILRTALLCYGSPSFDPVERPYKFRLLWRFAEPVTDIYQVRLLLARLMDLYPIDIKCKEVHRVWFGRADSEPLFESDPEQGIVPVEDIEQRWEWWAKDNPEGGHARSLIKRKERRSKRLSGGDCYDPHTYCAVVDGFLRDDVAGLERLMEIVPPWIGRGSGTYEAADTVLFGAAAWLGVELFLDIAYRKDWIWYDSKGSMDEIVENRLSKDEINSPKAMWYWMLASLVEGGSITEDQRDGFIRYQFGRGQV
jgi:hypothetical protein